MLEIDHVSKAYNGVPALRDVSLQVGASQIVCLLGPSGCGKSTLLRVIAGLEQADAGEIRFAGQSLDRVPTHQRGFGLMFQEYALFPHLNVGQNIAFGLQTKAERQNIRRRVEELLLLVGLDGYANRRVDALSGGERQRVALARSLAPNPRLLMLDEPLAALDRALRERLLDQLRLILKQVGVMSLYVTHDQAEAFALADWLVIMNAGQIEQQGPPQVVYRQPSTRFAARFLGLTNQLDGTIIETNETHALVETALGRFWAERGQAEAGQLVALVIRPEAAELHAGTTSNLLHGSLIERTFRGSRTRIALQPTSSPPLEFELDAPTLPQLGAPITLALRPEAMSLIVERRTDRLTR